jgi:coenzyme PQQ biosynthesis protein PqqD
MITAATRPRLAAKARLRYDRHSERYMLLYPERGMNLNRTAADVLQRCTGEQTVAAIITELAGMYGHEPAAVEREVVAFLDELANRGLVHDSSEP